jgi:hypothetical protein
MQILGSIAARDADLSREIVRSYAARANVFANPGVLAESATVKLPRCAYVSRGSYLSPPACPPWSSDRDPDSIARGEQRAHARLPSTSTDLPLQHCP